MANGNSYGGKVLRLTQDIDAGGVTVGTEGRPFCGIFDGDNHTLTVNYGSDKNFIATAAAGYYMNGCRVQITVPRGTPFNHWESGCFMSDPWTATGVQRLTDMKSKPILSISTSAIPAARLERELDGNISTSRKHRL